MDISALKKQLDQIMRGPLSPEEKRLQILGRKGLLTSALRTVGQLPAAERAQAGEALNDLRRRTETALQSSESGTAEVTYDLSVPPAALAGGSLHPLTLAIHRAVDIFAHLGFDVVEGSEVVTDWDNFESLHFHPDHPARDTQDTMLINNRLGWLLRTQTSAMQVPTMATRKPPFRFIVPGRTYRRESDATHVPMFHQLEGVIVDEEVSFSDLKGLLEYFIAEFFGRPMQLRFRPHFFPFTEPSAEVDVAWEKPGGKTGWLELLGCGCIHPEVLRNSGLDPKKYQGVAFGLGLDRHAMLLHGIPDVRTLFENREETLRQFKTLT